MACVVCGEGSSTRLFQTYGIWFRKCARCSYRFAEFDPGTNHTSEVYGDDYFLGGGAGYSDYLSERSLLIQHGKRYADIVKKYSAPGSLLDIGAAAGFILRGLVDSGWRGEGIEPNPRMAQFARAEEGLQVSTRSFEEFQSDKKYNLITMIQIIGHFCRPDDAFAKVANLLAPGGLFLVETWDPDSLIAKILGRHWHIYVPPSILHVFAPRDLARLGQNHGLTKVAYGKPTKWLDGAHVKSLMGYLLADKPVIRELGKVVNLIPNRMSVPYPALDLYWMLFQKPN